MSLYSRIEAFGRQPRPVSPRPLPAVVLGAKVYADGTPSDALRDRVAVGVGLFHAGHASGLVLSGGSPEAEVMRALARSVPDDHLRLERASRSTEENATFTAAMMAEREVLLVTCDFPLARATAWFRSAGFVVWPVPSPRRLSARDRRLAVGKEVLGFLRHPSLLAFLQS